jgi:Rad3-related DNA helicase
MKMRAEETGAILPPFQVLVLDEAHKILPAARSLYGSDLAVDAIPAITKVLTELNFAPLVPPVTDNWKVIRDKVYLMSGKLYAINKQLFSRSDAGIDCDRIIRHIRDFADLLIKCLSASRKFAVERDEQLKHSLIWELQRINKTANELFDSGSMIRWFVTADDTRTAIGGIPKELSRFLYDDLWSRGIPGRQAEASSCKEALQ